jgi:hypothetical protein
MMIFKNGSLHGFTEMMPLFTTSFDYSTIFRKFRALNLNLSL